MNVALRISGRIRQIKLLEVAPIRVQLVSDDQMLANALARRLAQDSGGFLVDRSTSDVAQTLATARGHGPGVLLIDAAAVTGHWSAIADVIAPAEPDLRVVVLAEAVDAEDALLAALRRVSAWLPPDIRAADLVEVLRQVGDGYAFYPPVVLGTVLRRLVEDLPARRPGSGPLTALTERERDVLGCLVEGRHGQEIADRLDIAANTVRSHTSRILQKLGVHSRLEAVRVARKYGFAGSTARRW